MPRLNGHRRRVLTVLGCTLLLVGLTFFGWRLLHSDDPEIEPANLAVAESSSPLPGEPRQSSLSSAVPVPFSGLEGFGRVNEYQQTQTLESWRIVSEQSCSTYASEALAAIQSQNLELVEAGYMDLSGESWGCVLRGADNESFLITLIPEHPFSPRSDTNRLVVNILYYLQPKDIS